MMKKLLILILLISNMVFSDSLEEITNNENYKKIVEMVTKQEELSKRTEIVLKNEKFTGKFGNYSFKITVNVEGSQSSEETYAGSEAGINLFFITEYELAKNISGVTPEEFALSNLDLIVPKEAKILAKEKGGKSGYVIFSLHDDIMLQSITCFKDSYVYYSVILTTTSGHNEKFLNVYKDLITSVKMNWSFCYLTIKYK